MEKEKNTNKKEKSNGLTASHPSVKGQRPQERWIGAPWESQEANPLPSYRLSATVRITGYRRSVCRPGSSSGQRGWLKKIHTGLYKTLLSADRDLFLICLR